MKLTADQTKALRIISRGRSQAQLKSLFAAIRANSDRALFSAIAPPKKRARRKRDPLLNDLERTLKPLLAPASEKADLLVEHMARKYRRKLQLQSKGLAQAVKALRTRFSDDQILDGAKSLMGQLTRLYGGRETVV
jgi:hypothetical protein